jgi:hypothetical protein
MTVARSGSQRGVDAKYFREADLVAGEAARATQAVAPNFFGVARAVHALISDRLEERWL